MTSPTRHSVTDYRDEAPQVLCDFLSYHESIKAHSQKTVDEYFLDLRNFFRYLKQEKGLVPPALPFDQIEIEDIDLAFIRDITLSAKNPPTCMPTGFRREN